MSDDNSNRPIIIKKIRRGGHGGHHGGAWKVAFADFMTAMMAFFLVLWLVGQEPEVKEAVQGFFRDPGKFTDPGGAGVLKGSETALKSDSPDMAIVRPPVPEDKSSPSKDEVQQMKMTAKLMLEELEKQEAFLRLRENVTIQITSEGLRIILNESENSPAFFEPGSAKLLQQSAIILVTIADQLGKIPNKLVMEGHTSASHASTIEYTNWELSVDRANSARALMEVSGLTANQVREVRGFADKFPMITSNPEDSRNRRVSIVVLYDTVARRYDQVHAAEDIQTDSELPESSQLE
ncbi:MAG: flagellar motor protein MotB [candidate division Zixibacteria bacterium]|nr:flagellar motor protein MotB [candidate division Zixibacteria bacterium]